MRTRLWPAASRDCKTPIFSAPRSWPLRLSTQRESLQTGDVRRFSSGTLEHAQKAVALGMLSRGPQHVATVYFYRKQHAQAIAEAERSIALVPTMRIAMASWPPSELSGQPKRAIAEDGERCA